MSYELKLANPKEFYAMNHRPAHFLNFSNLEADPAGGGEQEDFFA